MRLDRRDVVYLHFLWVAWLADIIRGSVSLAATLPRDRGGANKQSDLRCVPRRSRMGTAGRGQLGVPPAIGIEWNTRAPVAPKY